MTRQTGANLRARALAMALDYRSLNMNRIFTKYSNVWPDEPPAPPSGAAL